MSNQLPKAVLLLTHKTTNFDRWYEVFDANEPLRRDHGILGHHVNRMRGDDQQISVYLAVGDVEAAETFLHSASLKAVMKDAGLEGPPEITWLKPRSENVVWDREVPSMIVRHSVKDFAHWKKIYDAAAAIRTKYGIIGEASNTLLDDENMVIVYHQAETFEVLEKYLADPELKEAMDLAGVTSEPEVLFTTGGWAKRYSNPSISPEDSSTSKKSDSQSAHP